MITQTVLDKINKEMKLFNIIFKKVIPHGYILIGIKNNQMLLLKKDK